VKVIIAGGRAFEDMGTLRGAIADAGFAISAVVSGACGIDASAPSRDSRIARGADGLGETWARLEGIPIRRFYAAFHELGRAAGPIRNAEMAEYGEALIALPGDRGTASMIREARKRGLRVFEVIHGAPEPTFGRRTAPYVSTKVASSPNLFEATTAKGRDTK